MILLPQYGDYTHRARFLEGLSLAAGAKYAVSEYYATTRSWPLNNQQVGLHEANMISGNAVTSVKVSPKGQITVSFNQKLDNGTLILTPVSAGKRTLRWDCMAFSVPSNPISEASQIQNQSSRSCMVGDYAAETRQAIDTFFETHQRLPQSLKEVALSPSKNESIDIKAERIQITLHRGNIASDVIETASAAKPSATNEKWRVELYVHPTVEIKWDCSGGSVPEHYRPSNCRS